MKNWIFIATLLLALSLGSSGWASVSTNPSEAYGDQVLSPAKKAHSQRALIQTVKDGQLEKLAQPAFGDTFIMHGKKYNYTRSIRNKKDTSLLDMGIWVTGGALLLIFGYVLMNRRRA